MNSRELTLGVLIMSFNEQRCISRAIGSVEDQVDVIQILDTGSSDDTVNICRQFEKVEISIFEWTDSFSDARNYGLSKLKSDVCLVLDADEYLDSDVDLRSIVSGLKDQGSLYCPVIVNSNDSVVKNIPRLYFRIGSEKFIGKVHEYLHRDLAKVKPLDSLKIFHDGYDRSIYDSKDKYLRNRVLALSQLKDDPESLRWNYFAARYLCWDDPQLADIISRFTNLSLPFLEEDEIYCLNMRHKAIGFHLYRGEFDIATNEAETLGKYYNDKKIRSLEVACRYYSLMSDFKENLIDLRNELSLVEGLASDPCVYESISDELIPAVVEGVDLALGLFE